MKENFQNNHISVSDEDLCLSLSELSLKDSSVMVGECIRTSTSCIQVIVYNVYLNF